MSGNENSRDIGVDPVLPVLCGEAGSQSACRFLPIAVLCISLGASLVAWWMLSQSYRDKAQAVYSDMVSDVTGHIVRRLHDHEQILLGGVGLFNAGNTVTRQEWREYVSTLQLDENHPGILGVGYSIWLSPQEKVANEKALHREGFPEYVIKPEGIRPHYTSIIYLEPFSWRNQRAFGYDMYTESVRHEAIDKAIDSGKTTVAAKIILVQETDKDKQSGMLMYAPVYRLGMPKDSVEQRRSAFRGLVYSPIRMNDFVLGTLEKLPQDVAFELYGDETGSKDSLMFSSTQVAPQVVPAGYTPVFSSQTKINLYGKTWCINFKTLPDFSRRLEKGHTRSVLAIGVLTSLLLTWISSLLLNTRNKAMTFARSMSQEVVEQKMRLEILHNRFRLAVNSGGIGVWDWYLRDNTFIWDEWMYRLFGTPPVETADVTAIWKERVHPDDRERVEAEIISASQGEKEVSSEFRVQWPDGSERHLKVHALLERDDQGAPLRMAGVVYDITGLKLADSAIRDANSKVKTAYETLNAIILTLSDWVWEVDDQGRYIYCSPQVEAVLGYSPEELIGKTPFDFMPPDEVQKISATFAEVCGRRDRIINLENWNFHKNGTLVLLLTNGVPVSDEQGNFTGYRGVDSDITHRKRIEAEREQAYLAAEAANTAKSRFLANMSHEIRTPLNAVIGYSSLMRSFTLTPTQLTYIERIHSSGELLLNTINDILDFSKIETGMLSFEEISFSSAIVIDNALGMVHQLAQRKGLRLLKSSSADIAPFLVGDPYRLVQVVVNLLSNAVKFTAQGEIELEVSLLKEEYGRQQLLFSIRDTGIGISSEQFNRLFSPFTQADASTTRQYGGTGLGLSISKLLVEMMEGSIWCESIPGKGSNFCFTAWFGIGQTDTLNTRSVDSSRDTMDFLTSFNFSGNRILLVEDNVINQELALELLKNTAADIDVAVNGREAVSMVCTGDITYQLVLMDIQMPEMDGFEATRLIRSDGRFDELPIIAMTAHAMQDDHKRILQSGMDAHITKPIDFRMMLQVINSFLDGGTPGGSPVGADDFTEPDVHRVVDTFPEPSRGVVAGLEHEKQLPTGIEGLDVAAALERLDGRTEIYLRLMASFVENREEFGRIILDALRKGDRGAAIRHAHTVKSTAGIIGAEKLQRLAQMVETAIETDEPSDSIESSVTLFAGELERLVTALKDFMRPAH